jgi:hypothetical protein
LCSKLHYDKSAAEGDTQHTDVAATAAAETAKVNYSLHFFPSFCASQFCLQMPVLTKIIWLLGFHR